MAKDICGYDCAAECLDRECHFVGELDDGRVAAFYCRGNCDGRCAGRLETGPLESEELRPPGVRPDRASRATVRSRRLYVEAAAEGADAYEVSCAVGCFVAHAAEATGGPADCYGSCLGICYGVATVHEIYEVSTPRREG
jgi:hypothetical protein